MLGDRIILQHTDKYRKLLVHDDVLNPALKDYLLSHTFYSAE
jgi:hypothetical protein